MPQPSAKRFVSLDLEVTALDPEQAEIIDVGLVAFSRDGVMERFDSLVRPKGEVPFVVQSLTGITPEMLTEAPSFEEVAERIAEFVGDSPVVGQSIDFDLAHLRAKGIYPKGSALDTFHLAAIFLPGLTSHRLEAIAAALGVELVDAHRALPDAEATALVFRRLLDLIERRISPELAREMGEILARSSYGLGELWDELRFQGSEAPKSPETRHRYAPTARPATVDFVREVLAGEDSRVGLAEPRSALTAALGELVGPQAEALIAVPSLEQARWLGERLHLPLVLSGEHYLSERRARVFISGSRFSDPEAVFALKIRYFLEWTKEGRRDELSLFDIEYRLWRLISCEGLTEEERAGERFFPTPGGAGVTNHRSLLELRTEEGLIISDFQLLDETIATAGGVNIDQRDGVLLCPEARSSFDLTLGLAGIVLEHFSEPSVYGRVLRLRPAVIASKEWAQFASSARHFIEVPPAGTVIEREFQSGLGEQFGRLLDGVQSEIAWIAERGENLALRLAPQSLEPLLTELRASAKRLVLLSKSLEGVPRDLEVVREESGEGPRVWLIRSEGRSELELLRELLLPLEDSGKRIAVFAPSASMIREVFEPLSTALSTELVGTGFSGSESRVIDQAREDEGKILLAGPRLWADDRLDGQFDLIVVPRLFFDPPSEPIHQARSERSGGFMGYSLPRSVARLRMLVAKLREGGELVLLDQRLISQRYGSEIVKQLDLPTKEVGLDEFSLA